MSGPIDERAVERIRRIAFDQFPVFGRRHRPLQREPGIRVRAAVLLIGVRDRAPRRRAAGARGSLRCEGDLGAGERRRAGPNFPLYHAPRRGDLPDDPELGRGRAPTAPADPTDPNDPAYEWPAYISYAIQHAAHYHMKVMLQVEFTPSWANGGQANELSAHGRERLGRLHHGRGAALPHRSPLDDLGRAKSPRPSSAPWSPRIPVPPTLTPGTGGGARRSTRSCWTQLRRVLKAANPSNLVIGGNTYTTGDISTEQWIENMRLPDGQPPRMDLYGHNPFSWRPPDLLNPPSPDGQVDFSDLGRLAQLVQSNFAAPGQQIKLFLSEWTIPTAPGRPGVRLLRDPRCTGPVDHGRMADRPQLVFHLRTGLGPPL